MTGWLVIRIFLFVPLVIFIICLFLDIQNLEVIWELMLTYIRTPVVQQGGVFSHLVIPLIVGSQLTVKHQGKLYHQF